jgi:hypothetical protein
MYTESIDKPKRSDRTPEGDLPHVHEKCLIELNNNA